MLAVTRREGLLAGWIGKGGGGGKKASVDCKTNFPLMKPAETAKWERVVSVAVNSSRTPGKA